MSRLHQQTIRWLLSLLLIGGLAAAAEHRRPIPKHPARRPAATQPARNSTPAPTPTSELRIELAPPAALERAKATAERDDPLGLPRMIPPVDRPISDTTMQGQLTQITPTTLQLRERDSGVLRTINREQLEMGRFLIGDHVQLTTTASGETALTILPANR